MLSVVQYEAYTHVVQRGAAAQLIHHDLFHLWGEKNAVFFTFGCCILDPEGKVAHNGDQKYNHSNVIFDTQ